MIKEQLLKQEQYLKSYATKNGDAIRLYNIKEDIRPEYFRDADRIIYSKAYSRYMDKTQVFTNIQNDHITRRMSHVQMVSKISRTIGRALSLNEDLIEAIALGHDLGHVPFGHLGETFLNELSQKHNEGIFMHNVQSVRNVMNLEKNGQGLNLTIQVLDGILCHNGEILEKKYYPIKKTKEQFLKEYEDCYKDIKNILKLKPMTLEGCVVRISDIISYIGKDIEDAIMLGVLKKEEIPENIKNILGENNNDIITNIVMDIIENSIDKPYITMSDKINKALDELKKFNYENIYYKAITEKQKKQYKTMFKTVFDYNLKCIEHNKKESSIYKIFLNNMNEEYIKKTTNARKVIDYIAGMTDNYFIKEYETINQK
ncbi:MAG: HD domain-containing protein [Bacilli bacterium]|nr:HD domain-containing protein [Bacilli bacterium]MBP3921307.1 HD domain-containing protein [Bacilli bacterium]